MGARFSAPVRTGPRARPAFCTRGTESFPGVLSGRGMTLTPHPLLVPWSWKSRAIPLLPLWAVRPVQSLSACIRMYFTLPFLLGDSPASEFYMSGNHPEESIQHTENGESLKSRSVELLAPWTANMSGRKLKVQKISVPECVCVKRLV
jgi:hypothetical protein